MNDLSIKTVVLASIFTDQCVSSTVISLRDESFEVIVPHDATAAATMGIHNAKLMIINHIYAQYLAQKGL